MVKRRIDQDLSSNFSYWVKRKPDFEDIFSKRSSEGLKKHENKRSMDLLTKNTKWCGMTQNLSITMYSPHLLHLAPSVTRCSCNLAVCFVPSVISPGRSEGVSRATSQRPRSKNGHHGYFESQLWPLEHVLKRAESATLGRELGGLGKGETRLSNS